MSYTHAQQKKYLKFVPRETLNAAEYGRKKFHDFRIFENGVRTRWKEWNIHVNFLISPQEEQLSLSLLILYILHSMAAQIPFFHIISDHFAFEIIMCTRYIQFCKFFRHAKILISTALCCALELNIIYVELYAF